MIKLLWSGFIIMLVLSGCGWNGTPSRSANDFIPLTSIEITAVSSTIAAKTSTRLTVMGNFSGLFTRDITDQVVWSSDTPTTVAKFDPAVSPNRVFGIAPGSAILTATVGSVSATFNLTVSGATIQSIVITPVNPSISQGLTVQFTASGTFSGGTTQDLTFDAAWTPTPGTFATVSNGPASKGLATGIAEGVETITATFDNVNGTTRLTVTLPVLQSITITTANTSVLSLSTASFQAIGHFSDGTDQDITNQAKTTWSSSRPDFATIVTGGTATTLAQGTTSISASQGAISGATTLRVTGGTLTGFTVSPATVSLVKGTAARMTVTGTFSNGTTSATRDITGAVAWSPANTSLATVTTPGGNLAWLNALAVTQSTIVTAKAGTLPDTPDHTTNLTVTSPTLLSIAISPASFTGLIAGTSMRFIATGTFSGGVTQDVTASSTWITSDATKATVGDSGTAKGRVTGVTSGTITITAKYLRGDGVTVTSPSVTVTVTAPTLQSLTLPVAATVNSGNQVKFTATAVFSGGISQDVTEDTVWSIDKPNIAILADSTNQPGEVVGVDSGTATLTATFGGSGGKAQIMKITVVP